MNFGRPVPPTGDGGLVNWLCSRYDAYLAKDGSEYVAVDGEGSYVFGLDVNRICYATYKAY